MKSIGWVFVVLFQKKNELNLEEILFAYLKAEEKEKCSDKYIIHSSIKIFALFHVY